MLTQQLQGFLQRLEPVATIGKQRYFRPDDVALSLSELPDLKRLSSVIVAKFIARS